MMLSVVGHPCQASIGQLQLCYTQSQYLSCLQQLTFIKTLTCQHNDYNSAGGDWDQMGISASHFREPAFSQGL